MRAYFHTEQSRHRPLTYISRGKMRTPQEVPERAAQLVAAMQALRFELLSPPDAGDAPLGAVHAPGYLEFLRHAHARWHAVGEDWGEEVISNVFVREPNALRGVLAQAARYLADGSCPVGRDTWTSAYWSAQSAIAGAHALLEGDPAAYALCRPPGHHARRDAAGGFCYLNNAAIAAQLLRGQHARVAILDTDMHHGQGVQEIFYDRADVLYVSIHGDPTNFYPAVAGFADEDGAGAGKGYNLNLPMPHGSTEQHFLSQLAVALRAVRDFGATALVVCLGFDIYEQDPQSKVQVTRAGFATLGEQIRTLRLPTLIVQEGGYHLQTLRDNAAAFFVSPGTWRFA